MKTKEMKYNAIYSFGLCLIGDYLNKNNNTINNYDTSYRILDSNTIKIKLQNYYEKMFFIAKLNIKNCIDILF